MPSVGLNVKDNPLQELVLIELITAVGLTTTVTVNGAFTPHSVDVGVTI